MKKIFAAGTMAGVMLSFGLAAGPATAQPVPATSDVPTDTTGPSSAGLAEALRRDLGISLAEFDAAGELGRRAAEAAPGLRTLPGFVGISLDAGIIKVAGDGAELRARVTEPLRPPGLCTGRPRVHIGCPVRRPADGHVPGSSGTRPGRGGH